MKRQNPSIFNDIVGPVMVGPSSSHTCAPSRIGYTCQQMLKGKLTRAVIEFARDGAYTLMYKGQKSDLGFVNGLLGNRPENPQLRNSLGIARQKGIDISFEISEFKPIKPNLAKLTLYSDCGEVVKFDTDSTGGGTIKILNIDGYDVNIQGDCYELLVELDDDNERVNTFCEKLCSMVDTYESIHTSFHDGKSLINMKLRTDPQERLDLGILEAEPLVCRVRLIKPVLLVPSNINVAMPFKSAAELLHIAETEGKALWELGVDYEVARSGWQREDVFKQMVSIVEIMEEAIREAVKGDINMNGIITPSAGNVERFVKGNSTSLNMGVLNTAVPWAMATMEMSSAMGVVFCAPTGGSAGVFPGAILGVAEELGLSADEKAKLMFTTAVLGIVISQHHNYSAELYGCQVEPGAASGMAAGGLVCLMGGNAAQAMAAASCAIQNILGTICDPVAGLVQIPCINRNAMSVANAVVSANMIMGGFDPLIPLDETAETMFRVGMQLPSELRCTCKGGLCTTETGERLAIEQNARDNLR